VDRSTLYEWGTCLTASLEVHSSCYVPIQFDHVTLSIIKFIVAWPNFSTCLNEIIVIQHVNKVCTTNKHQVELGLTGDSTAQVAKWKEEVKLWESDKKKPNPFEVQVYCKLFLSWCRCWGCLNNDYKPWHRAVHHSFAEKEKAELITGDTFIIREDISATKLITMGMDLKEQQYVNG
jgi:hypothetical protein